MNKRLPISVFSRAHRALRGMPRFEFASAVSQMDRYREMLESGDSPGELIGVYTNPDEIQPQNILVAEHGLYVVRLGPAQWIKFLDIKGTQGPSAASESSDILLTLQSGIVVILRVAGRDGNFRDVFSFGTFLRRVLEDCC